MVYCELSTFAQLRKHTYKWHNYNTGKYRDYWDIWEVNILVERNSPVTYWALCWNWHLGNLVLTMMLAYENCRSILIKIILPGYTSLNMDLVAATCSSVCVWSAICMPLVFAWSRFKPSLSLVYVGSRCREEVDHFGFLFSSFFIFFCVFVYSLHFLLIGMIELNILNYWPLIFKVDLLIVILAKIYLFDQRCCCFLNIRASTFFEWAVVSNWANLFKLFIFKSGFIPDCVLSSGHTSYTNFEGYIFFFPL